jgi:hypothetical protein
MLRPRASNAFGALHAVALRGLLHRHACAAPAGPPRRR